METQEHKLEQAVAAVKDARERLTVEIVAAHTAGVKVPVIAEATGLTRQRIYQIVKEREES